MRALVVGGTAGIGLAVARRLAAGGARHLVLCGRDPGRAAEAAARLAAETGAQVDFHAADAGDPSQCAAMVASARATMGGIDALYSGAGGDPMPRLLKDTPLDAVMPAIAQTLAPAILPARAVYPFMAEAGGGAILCVASDAGKLATPGEVAIGAAMAAIAMFCRAMANEAARERVRVNCLTPSIVAGTPLYGKLMEDPFAGRLFAKAEARARGALGVVTPEDLAEAAAFLLGPGAAKITGQTISVTGGISAI